MRSSRTGKRKKGSEESGGGGGAGMVEVGGQTVAAVQQVAR